MIMHFFVLETYEGNFVSLTMPQNFIFLFFIIITAIIFVLSYSQTATQSQWSQFLGHK